MNDKHLYILLNVIKTNGDIRKLKREGIDYKKIAELTKSAITLGLVSYKDDKITLSKEGLKKLELLETKHKLTNKSQWIQAENESRIPKLGKDFIFLPNQNDIHF